jgi:hypothetical protein
VGRPRRGVRLAVEGDLAAVELEPGHRFAPRFEAGEAQVVLRLQSVGDVVPAVVADDLGHASRVPRGERRGVSVMTVTSE